MKLLAGAVFVAAMVGGASPVGALDTAANAIFQAAGVPNRAPTKVVPLVTAGGERAGFAQITGDSKALARIAAVVELRAGSPWQITAFVPVRRIDPGGEALKREYGVAVTALVAAP
ncbi:MAG TPA: hypothetical protein VFA29_15315 [Candidatus Baltobacteraceae bacterium]|nr:hypothetical protein [Candidatus Baltobacteraceae bacterium]